MNNGLRKMSAIFLATAAIFAFAACGGKEVRIEHEYYSSSYRQLPPEPVYSRVTWSHLPGPVAKRSQQYAPVLQPVLAFEMPDATLEEAVEALAQTIGYDWHYPAELGATHISIKMVGTVEEILQEISTQAGVLTELSHERRFLRVLGARMMPELPSEGNEGGAS